MSECANCGIAFAPKNGRQRYCSRDCAYETRACERCGDEFTAERRHGGRFCSRECSLFAARAAPPAEFPPRDCENCHVSYSPTRLRQRFCRQCLVVTRPCADCEKDFTAPRWANQMYCSVLCRLRGRQKYGGLLFDTIRGRWIITGRRRGEIELYARAVMAAHLRRELRSEEIVHHVNEDKADDRIENLQIVTRAEHARIHNSSRGDRAAA